MLLDNSRERRYLEKKANKIITWGCGEMHWDKPPNLLLKQSPFTFAGFTIHLLRMDIQFLESFGCTHWTSPRFPGQMCQKIFASGPCPPGKNSMLRGGKSLVPLFSCDIHGGYGLFTTGDITDNG